MAKEVIDTWVTDSGLLDDFDFTIKEARFATDMQYNNGETLLMIWEGETDDPDVPEQRIMYPCGNNWESRDGGKTAVNTKGRKRFIGTSLYGRVINRCVEELGMGELLRKRGQSTEAKVWIGLKFHMKREKIGYGDEIGEKERLMPVQFLGEVDLGKPTESKSESKPDEGQTKLLKMKLIALAKKCEDFDSFVTQAMEIPGVADNDELLALLVDENGIYKEARG